MILESITIVSNIVYDKSCHEMTPIGKHFKCKKVTKKQNNEGMSVRFWKLCPVIQGAESIISISSNGKYK
jgi:hypothetical protein